MQDRILIELHINIISVHISSMLYSSNLFPVMKQFPTIE